MDICTSELIGDYTFIVKEDKCDIVEEEEPEKLQKGFITSDVGGLDPQKEAEEAVEQVGEENSSENHRIALKGYAIIVSSIYGPIKEVLEALLVILVEKFEETVIGQESVVPQRGV